MNKRAFTLIELLVTVLIIAVLATIAFPQYKRAVLRTKAKEAVLNLRPIARAERLYYMANTDYTHNMDYLDVTPGKLKYFEEYLFHDEHVEVKGTYDGVDYWLTVFFSEPDTTYCGVVASHITIANPCAILSDDKEPRGDLYQGYLGYRL